MSILDELRLAESAKKEALSDEQAQTSHSFGFKWALRDTYESENSKRRAKKWLVDRYCGGDEAGVDALLAGGRKIVLDAGCGAGFSAHLLFGDRLKDHDYIGVDVSSSVDVARERFEKLGVPGSFFRLDLMSLPLPEDSVDIIFSEGVLHHTDSVKDAVAKLAKTLKPDGKFLFYVYRKKAPAREFTDDYIREQLKGMDDAAAWEALMPLAELGKALGDLGATVNVPTAVPLLGIPEGEISVQRLFYWYFCKMFYGEDLTLDEMNHINFDWFRPLNCHRHTPEEIESFCADAGLDIREMVVENAGITVKATRKA